jgi:hypothetical protein
MGDVTRFRSIKQAISYCGLSSDEKSSADKIMRTPLSKQRHKHLQRALVEAAKLAPRQDHQLALVYEKEKEKGHANRATRLFGSRGWGQTGLRGQRRSEQGSGLEPPHGRQEKEFIQRRPPGPAGGRLGEGEQSPDAPSDGFGTGGEHKLNLL